MHISSIIESTVKKWPNSEAVVCSNKRFNYKEFGTRIKKLANVLIQNGITPGARIGIIHHNCHIFLESYFAAAVSNSILTPINYRLSADELNYILQDSGAEVLITNYEYLKKIQEAISSNKKSRKLHTIIWTGEENNKIEEINEISFLNYERALENAKINLEQITQEPKNNHSTIAHLYYTSGTTGQPKGVILTHENVITHAQGTITEFQLSNNDIWGHIAPLYHLADAWATFAITMVGGRHVIVPKFEPKAVLDAIRQEKITISNLIPTMLNMLVNYPGAANETYPSLRSMLSGGAPIAPELVRKVIKTFGCDYVQTYGMTETSPYLTVSLLKEHLKQLPKEEQFIYQSRTGRPFITVKLKVVNESGQEVEPNNSEVGEIWVRGPNIFPGYWNDPKETAMAFSDDWFKTGDLAVIDQEGYINIVDRKKDMILTGGENVYSTEVEHVLYEYPGILEAAVIGVPDDKWGEVVKAVVVLKEGISASEDEIIDFCKSRLAHFKVPKSIEFIDELPKTGTGKIAKKMLKDKYWMGYDKRVH
jgi:acyl-CoA synthetase (AMP-forming)/AMP-acid ligase II